MPTVHPLLPLLLLACSRWPCTALVDNSTALVALFEESEAGFLVLSAQQTSPTLGQARYKATRVDQPDVLDRTMGGVRSTLLVGCRAATRSPRALTGH